MAAAPITPRDELLALRAAGAFTVTNGDMRSYTRFVRAVDTYKRHWLAQLIRMGLHWLPAAEQQQLQHQHREIVRISSQPNFAADMEAALGPSLWHDVPAGQFRKYADMYANLRACGGHLRRYATFDTIEGLSPDPYVNAYVQFYTIWEYKPINMRSVVCTAHCDMMVIYHVRAPLTANQKAYFLRLVLHPVALIKYEWPPSERTTSLDLFNLMVHQYLPGLVLHELEELFMQHCRDAEDPQRARLRLALQSLRSTKYMKERAQERDALRQANFTQHHVARASVPLPMDLTLLIESFVHGLRVHTREDAVEAIQSAASALVSIAAMPPSAATSAAVQQISAGLRKAADDLEHVDTKRARKDE